MLGPPRKRFRPRFAAGFSSYYAIATCRTGADEVVNYDDSADLKDAIKRITGGKGVDVGYGPVGDKYAAPNVRRMAWNGC